MLEHALNDIFPAFLLKDRNGLAMAKAVDAGMKYFTDRVEYGIKLIDNVDTMPEWRLDELAWEFDCFYDFTADVSKKRDWISNALKYSYDYGTPKATKDYLEGYFGEVTVMEGSRYGLDPYHFRVVMNGAASTDELSWAEKAIEKAKNVRSVSGEYAIGVFDRAYVRDSMTRIGQKEYRSGEYRAGEVPETGEE